nr:MAG TPA: upper collar protein [Caudoviricetes sp.]
MYDYINAEVSQHSPSTVHTKNTELQRFFARYLLQKAMSVFKWDLPETWDRDYFLYVLYGIGYIAVLNTDKYGVIPQQCGLDGYNIFYQPKRALVTNPLLMGLRRLEIGTQCTLIKLQPDYGSVMDLVGFYADMMALTAETAGVNLVNSRLSYVFFGKNKNTAESQKKLFDRVASGEPATFVDTALYDVQSGNPSWIPFQQNVGQNYIAGDALADLRKWEMMFDTDVGIPTANTDKKERLISDEVNANNVEVTSKADLWLDQLQKSFAQTSKMFGIKLGVEWRNKPQISAESEGGEDE